jgi:anaerobic selenocysteine-containing dehydrogenase
MRLVAERMGLSHPALRESDEQIAASALPDGVDLEALKAAGWHKTFPPRPTFDAGAPAFRIAGFTLGDASPSAGPMLQLLTPKSHYFLNSSFGNMPRHRRGMVRPTLEMHPSDARARGLDDGNRVTIANDRGTLHAHVHVTDAVRPGVVSLPGKWWGEPPDTSAVANLLTPSEWSPGGQPAYNDTWVMVSAAADVPVSETLVNTP